MQTSDYINAILVPRDGQVPVDIDILASQGIFHVVCSPFSYILLVELHLIVPLPVCLSWKFLKFSWLCSFVDLTIIILYTVLGRLYYCTIIYLFFGKISSQVPVDSIHDRNVGLIFDPKSLIKALTDLICETATVAVKHPEAPISTSEV